MEAMISFVDAYRDKHGVEPICRVIEIAPSTFHAHVARRDKPETAPLRVKRDVMLSVEIKRVFDENFQVYGVRKVWRQLLREGHDVGRCTVARLMKKEALQGVIRGGRVRTTVSDKATPCPLDHVNRKFRAPRPNVLWVSDFTYFCGWVELPPIPGQEISLCLVSGRCARYLANSSSGPARPRAIGWNGAGGDASPASRRTHLSFLLATVAINSADPARLRRIGGRSGCREGDGRLSISFRRSDPTSAGRLRGQVRRGSCLRW